jgi:hypothetical protein
MGGQRHALAALPPAMTQYTLCRKLGGIQGWSGRVRNTPSPPGFDPRTVKPVASCYTANTHMYMSRYICKGSVAYLRF